MAANKEDMAFRLSVRNQLNETLIIKQDLSAEQIERIIELQISKHYIYKQMQEASIACENGLLKELAGQATEVELSLQTAWNFKQDTAYHRFWEMPGCQCLVFQNIEKFGTGEYQYLSTCPIHGTKCK